MTAKVSIGEAGARLRLSYNQVLRLVLIGQLKGERREGRWYVHAGDVERFAREREREAVAAR